MKVVHIVYNKRFDDECKLAADAGFKNIEVNFCYMEDFSDKAFYDSVDDISETLLRYNLKAVQSHLYYYDLLLSSENIIEDKERQIKRAIEVCGRLGIPWCVWHPRAHSDGGYSRELSFKDNREQILRHLECAHRYGTGIALENLMSWPGHHMYGSKYEELVELTDSFNDEKVGICWDFGHANLMDFSQLDALRYIGKRLKCTHVHNNFKNRDLHLSPDNGVIDWVKIMPVLKEIDYKGPLTLETEYCYNDEEMIKEFYSHNYKCLEFLEKLMK